MATERAPGPSEGIFVLGTSHRDAKLAVREKLCFAPEEIPVALQRLRRESSLEEALLLSTCNRLEIYGAASAMVAGVENRLIPFLSRERGVPEAELRSHLYWRSGKQAVQHCFRVASSLDSLVVGEAQILGQVKEAVALAQAGGCLGPRLDPLFRHALRTARTVRAKTAIGQGTVSVASIAVDLAKKIFSDLSRQRVLVLGAGEMAELCLKHLLDAGARSLVVANRDAERARALAVRYGGQSASLADLYASLENADIVVSCLGAPEPIVFRKHLGARRVRPLFLIDLALPRSVEEGLHSLENVYLYNLDDLESLAAANLESRRAAMQFGLEIVEAEVGRFELSREREGIDVLLASFRQAFDRIEDEEAARLSGKLEGRLDAKSLEELRASLRRICGRLFHHTAKTLRHNSVQELREGDWREKVERDGEA